MLKRFFLLTCAGLWFFSTVAEARFFPKWFGRVSAGYSYWKLEHLDFRIENRRKFFEDAGDSNYKFKRLPANHLSFDLGMQFDVFSKVALLGTFEFRQATRINTTATDSFRVEAITRPREINLGLDAFWRMGPKGNLLVGGGGGLSFARFRQDVRFYDRRTDPDFLSSFLLEKYSSVAIYGELRAVYLLPLSFLRAQNFFVEVLGRLNPIEAFTGTVNQNGQTTTNAQAFYFPPGSSAAQPVKLDFSGFYIGVGSNFRL